MPIGAGDRVGGLQQGPSGIADGGGEIGAIAQSLVEALREQCRSAIAD
jgi:hypothetical protein